MKEPILITGCARSGTSLIAGVINICGAFGGRMSGPNLDNAKGMFENNQIRNGMVKPFLASLGVDQLGQFPLPNTEGMPIPSEWSSVIEQIMIDEGYTDGPWMYKDAKVCLMWPVWHDAFPNAKWVIVRRKTPDIINSCIRTGFMRAFTSPNMQKSVGAKDAYEGWYWWVKQHEARFAEMIEAGLQIKQVWPERMVERDYRQTQDLIEWLGLEWDNKIFDFIEPKLWKSRKKVSPKNL